MCQKHLSMHALQFSCCASLHYMALTQLQTSKARRRVASVVRSQCRLMCSGASEVAMLLHALLSCLKRMFKRSAEAMPLFTIACYACLAMPLQYHPHEEHAKMTWDGAVTIAHAGWQHTARKSMADSLSCIFIFLACRRSSTRLACSFTMRLMSCRCSALKTVNSSMRFTNSGLKWARTYTRQSRLAARQKIVSPTPSALWTRQRVGQHDSINITTTRGVYGRRQVRLARL